MTHSLAGADGASSFQAASHGWLRFTPAMIHQPAGA
jgi:hypothetical protein